MPQISESGPDLEMPAPHFKNDTGATLLPDMPQLGRMEFITKSAMALAAAVLAPVPLWSAPNDAGIVDLHCHPSLKMYLWNKKIWKKGHPSAGTNEFPLQYTIDELTSGNVRGLLVAHYLPEAALIRESDLLKRYVFPFVKTLCPSTAAKIEHGDPSNFTQINVMIDTLEAQVHLANQKQTKVTLVIARSLTEFDQAIAAGQIPIAHAIEGAHALGTQFPSQEPSWYVRNLEALTARGVCLMTLAHIFRNDIAWPVEGISFDEKKKLGLHWTYTPADDHPLSDVGRAIVEKMLDLGIIVDLTHSTPAARKEIFEINRRRGKEMRPLTFTHAGAQAIFEKYDRQYNADAYDNFKYYDVCDEEIDWICECGGTIGIIPENFWLLGCDPALNKKHKAKFKNGIEYMVETIEYINAKTPRKNYENISIGSDFDGFADAPADLYKPSHLSALIQSLRDHGLSDLNIRKIASENALRLLRNGWGPQVP
jgi:microsomal dipeptidase-like Zn-dependent dipeptidase